MSNESSISRIREVAEMGGSDVEYLPTEPWVEGDIVPGPPRPPGHIDDAMFVDGEFVTGGSE
jgi:hypothetical protein